MDALSEVVEAGGETDRMDALLEIGTKSCEAGTDSARKAPHKDVPLEASLLQSVDAVGGTPVVAQTQITMVQTDIDALRDRFRVISHEIQGVHAGKDGWREK